VTYGVDLDSGPDRPIHGLVHGVCPRPNLRPAEIALFILLHGARCSGPHGAAAGGNSCGEHGGGAADTARAIRRPLPWTHFQQRRVATKGADALTESVAELAPRSLSTPPSLVRAGVGKDTKTRRSPSVAFASLNFAGV